MPTDTARAPARTSSIRQGPTHPQAGRGLRKAVRWFLDGYFATCHRSPKTLAAYQLDLNQFMRSLPRKARIESVVAETVEGWVASLRKAEFAASSIRRKVASLRVFFGFLVRRGWLNHSPLSHLRFDFDREKPLIRALTQDEIDGLLMAAAQLSNAADDLGPAQRFLAYRNHALIALLYATGIRVGELTGLSLSSVRTDDYTLVVPGKGGRERMAFLVDPRTQRTVRRYLRLRSALTRDDGALFLNRVGRRLSTQGVANVLESLAGVAGIRRHVTPHMLRHTVATLLLRNGADLRIVQEFLGHASIMTTQRYTHVAKEQLLERLRLAHPNLRRAPRRAPKIASTPDIWDKLRMPLDHGIVRRGAR